MADTLNDVITKISALVSQETSVTNTSDEYALWRSYVNMAQHEWAEAYEWPSLYREYCAQTTAAGAHANGATISLPADFRKFAGYVKVTADGTTTDEYPEIDPYKKDQHLDTDVYMYRIGDYMVVNPGTLVSGASYTIPYFKAVASLASPADAIECSNSEYLVQRCIAYIWESREDGRFPQAKVEAEKILMRMIEFESARGAGYDASIQTPEQRNFNFRLGRD